MDAVMWVWESAFACVDALWVRGQVWEWLRPLVVWGQVFVFICFLLVASIGRRLKLRRKYVEVLDGIFQFAAYVLNEDEEEGEEGDRGSDSSENDSVVICPESPRAGPVSPQGTFLLDDPMAYLTAGMRAVVQDCVSKSLTAAELHTWNMLSRTKRKRYLNKSPPLTVFWACGFVVRWVFLLPVRVLLLLVSLSTLVLLCAGVGLLPTSDFKRRLNARVVVWCFDFVAGSLSFVARFHNPENCPTHGIAVANHTSPIDSMILATDQCYDMVGQKTRGILGVFMSALARSSSHIWFERSESRERAMVTQIIQEHAQDRSKPPILIFPEGVCLNNTAVMQFKKGAFEIDSVIYPVAIRFDLRYGDPYWWQNTFGMYLLHMMTSWAIVCDIWYLPPTYRAPRVRAQIAHAGGLVELAWDGYVKIAKDSDRWRAKEGQWRDRQQREYARRFSEKGEKMEERVEEEGKGEGGVQESDNLEKRMEEKTGEEGSEEEGTLESEKMEKERMEERALEEEEEIKLEDQSKENKVVGKGDKVEEGILEERKPGDRKAEEVKPEERKLEEEEGKPATLRAIPTACA